MRRPPATIRTGRGAVLLDALIAIAVFALGVLADLTLQAQGMRDVEAIRARGDAVRLADEFVARIWADDPARIADRYDGARHGAGYAEFAARAASLPGGAVPENAASIQVARGPTPNSRKVTIVLHWQLPGDTRAHRHRITTVVGRD